ncbi:hypothetical protein FHR83_007127 [Actinoplanes campanulatus]|uniref:Uncharacterized protein n=1 Tax=Actinoplanes campanulatus TaxID=113559 RepID=A0A7W5ANA0_9ACTN|nr:hypothetical protein [Actinoplanes campanulatus]MBB3099421.1 hypothetical protein [Actinoplanes campanulatus]GGN40073.1 hypothetical protein GCM10010109_68650 [Actinoplanes campanulatus]GID42370.1 hypothetical protein Aca09nite_88760 [Actinoplanes campanulatus]
MGINIVNPSEFTGGAFLKPAEHMNDLALLVKPKRIDKNVESTYQGQTRVRDEVIADVTVFSTSESLEKGIPSRVIKGCKIAYGMLTGTLERILNEGPDGAIVSVIRKVPTSKGSGYAFRDVEASVLAQVVKYAEALEAEVEKALSDVPDF